MSSDIATTAKLLTEAQPVGERPSLTLVRGVVTGRETSVVNVRQEGADTPLSHIRSLMGAGGPYVGQGVWMLEAGTNRVVLGPSESDDATRCHVRRTSNQTFASAAFSAGVSWSLADDNVGPAGGQMWRSATPTRVNILVDGAYLISWALAWAATANAGLQYAAVIRNGATDTRYAPMGVLKPAVNDAGYINGSGIAELSAGDYIELFPFQTTGANLALNAAAYVNSLHMMVSWLTANI